MGTSTSFLRGGVGPILIGLLLGLVGVRLLLSFNQTQFELVSVLAFLAGIAGLLSAYALFRGRHWWARSYVPFCCLLLAARSSHEFLDGEGLVGAAGYIVFIGAVWLAVGMYLRSAMRRHPNTPIQRTAG